MANGVMSQERRRCRSPGTAADHRSLDLRSHDRADAPPLGTGQSMRLRGNLELDGVRYQEIGSIHAPEGEPSGTPQKLGWSTESSGG